MTLDDALACVAAHTPRTVTRPGLARAATALVLCGGDEPAFALIRRAARRGDPWSGHAALPGGRRHPGDADAAATARREAFEEVGLELGEPVGLLDDLGGRVGGLAVTPVVFTLPAPAPLRPDPREVASAHWAPLGLLTDRAARARHPWRFGPWPAWRYDDGGGRPLVVWGLTYQVLVNFREVAGW